MLTHQTLSKWNEKTTAITQYEATLDENIKVSKAIKDAYSLEVFSKYKAELDVASKKFKHGREAYNKLADTCAKASSDRDAAHALVIAGTKDPEIALRNHTGAIVADAQLAFVARALQTQEALVTTWCIALQKKDHGVDREFEKQGEGYVIGLCHPDNFYSGNGSSTTAETGHDPTPFLAERARAHGAALTLEQSRWLPFSNELCRIRFASELAEVKRARNEGDRDPWTRDARRQRNRIPSLSDLETILQARSEGYAAATRARQNQIQALQAQLVPQ